MGLKSGKHGAKAELRARYPEAFREFESLADARDASMATRGETFAVIDGNVLIMSVPQAAATLDDYVKILTASLKRAIATCHVTVVVFDEPAAMTEAKIQEQMKRDASRASRASGAVVCSADIGPATPVGDNYTRQWLESARDVHSLVQNRLTRQRFFDEVSRVVLATLGAQIKRWNDSGYSGGHLIFDGVDLRGADRPASEPRVATVAGSCSRLAALFARTEPIGEGDLKLAALGRRARRLSETNEPGFESTKLSLCTTIDTDSFCIELIEEAKRADVRKDKPFNTLLCMRERTRKRGADDEKAACYLCCDVAMLHALLQRHVWGAARSPTQPDRQAAMTLLAAGLALSGCDFVELKGMRSDYVFDAVPIVVKTVPAAIEGAKFAWTGVREDVFKLEPAIKALAMACASRLAETPGVKKGVLPSVRDPDQNIILRTAWLMSYWCGNEFKGDMHEFGFFSPFSAD